MPIMKKKTRKKMRKMLKRHGAELLAGLVAGIVTKLLDAAGGELADLNDTSDGRQNGHKKRLRHEPLPKQLRALGGRVADVLPADAVMSAIRAIGGTHRSGESRDTNRKSPSKSPSRKPA